MTQRSIEARLDEVESRTAIAALVAGYCEGVDHANVELFLRLWHEDASYLIPGGRGDFVGIDRIRESQDVIGRAWASTKHWTTNHTVTFDDPDRATGRSDAFAICEHHDGRVSLVSATYDDQYERRDGTWRFAKRLVTRWFVSDGQDIKLLEPF
ncbi:nuclear transport factor 2 family protein [Phytohabitans sp. ZYX-F-186]|uniref:Nuclear transport factor 2 family protein n=1 Tax=Phytohabitans maris TaxID=3071409 RepID=A0ABU0ZK82_9ACTN|nr:nuclear transport factor 2 family protein [Phytohabitans sp. ZYX-F-186]MDQ7907467.1 nuclear transport factor 2 family protein [Phytohabitans sp. ZYX-F-186]